MTMNIFQQIKTNQKTRIKKLLKLKKKLSLSDYFKTQSIFAHDSLYFSGFELFLNKKEKLSQGRYFIEEWIIFFVTDITIKKWLLNNSCLHNIKILIPYCGSGAFTQIVIECLFIHFKNMYPLEDNQVLLEKIIIHHVQSWDTNIQCLNITQNRIQYIFNVKPVIKHTTTILENDKFDIIIGAIPFGDLLSNDFKSSINTSYEDIALNFIDWGLKHLENNGECFYFVNASLPLHKTYIQWRQQQYNDLTLHTAVEFISHQHKQNPITLMAIGLNNQKNYTINYYSLDDFIIQENIPVELLYQRNNAYGINLQLNNC